MKCGPACSRPVAADRGLHRSRRDRARANGRSLIVDFGHACSHAARRFTLSYDRGDTYLLENIGDAMAQGITFVGHETLIGPDRVSGGPNLGPGEALTFIAARSMATSDSTITVSCRESPNGAVLRWSYALPSEPRRWVHSSPHCSTTEQTMVRVEGVLARSPVGARRVSGCRLSSDPVARCGLVLLLDVG